MKYKVRSAKDDTWQVVEVDEDTSWDDFITKAPVCYQGSLADCEAWIRLTEKGLL